MVTKSASSQSMFGHTNGPVCRALPPADGFIALITEAFFNKSAEHRIRLVGIHDPPDKCPCTRFCGASGRLSGHSSGPGDDRILCTYDGSNVPVNLYWLCPKLPTGAAGQAYVVVGGNTEMGKTRLVSIHKWHLSPRCGVLRGLPSST